MAVKIWGRERSFNDSQERQKLAEIIPLPGPMVLQVDTTNLCNFKCDFCPTGHPELLKEVGRPKGRMPFPLFEKMLRDLKEFPSKLKVLTLHKDGEPLMNPEFGKMALRAREMDISERIIFATNGALLKDEKIAEILDADVDTVLVSVEHVTDEGYKLRTKTFGHYDTIRENVGRFFAERERRNARTKIWVKIIRFDLTDEQITKFGNDFEGICDECLVMSPRGWSQSDVFDFTLGTNPSTGIDGVTQINKRRIVCPYPFYTMAVNFDGSVSVCCLDWSHGAVVGDIRENTLREVWEGERMRGFRIKHLEGKRCDIKACANCQPVEGMRSDSDLDDVRESLLKIFRDDTAAGC